MKKRLDKKMALVRTVPGKLRPSSNKLSEEPVPRITNETVSEHREEVLKGARKYIYPLQHSKHRIVTITTAIVIAASVAFLTYCILGLYRFNADNAFLYRITQVIPFPVARTGGRFIAYENYLFELRHYKHYYTTQLQRNFKSDDDKQQLVRYRQKALQLVVDEAYIKKLAKQNNISVSGSEVSKRIALVKSQNRLGSNNRVFEDVLKDYWGWSTRDFERSLQGEILAEKVVAKLDTATHQKAIDAKTKLDSGTPFADLAKQVSDDPSKANGGNYGFAIDKTNRNVPPQVVDALFKLKPGEVSGIIDTGSNLEIVKLNEVNGNKVTASHIVFNYQDISKFIATLKAKQKVHEYIKV